MFQKLKQGFFVAFLFGKEEIRETTPVSSGMCEEKVWLVFENGEGGRCAPGKVSRRPPGEVLQEKECHSCYYHSIFSPLT